MEAWTSRRKAWLGDRGEPLLTDTCLKPWLLELAARSEPSRRGLCPDPSSPARLPASPSSPAREAGDRRGHTPPRCHGGSGGRGLSQVLWLMPERGLHPTATPWLSPSWGISGSPLTLPPSDACGCGRLAPETQGFLVCRCQEGQGSQSCPG